MEVLSRINNSHLYRQTIGLIRGIFASSDTKEKLNARMETLFSLTSCLFLKNGPRNKQKQHVLEKLAFYKEHISPNSRVVDVGCFDGYYTQQLRQHGCETLGVDANIKVLEKTRSFDPEGKYVREFAENLSFPDNYFDVGLYSHILHHVLKPEEVIKEARRIIKPGGKIIVAVPLNLGVDANHLRSFDRIQLETLIRSYFPNVAYFPRIGKGHGCIASYNNQQ